MPNVTFHEFVSRLRGIDSPVGDFCTDYLRKPMPEGDPKSWRGLRRFLSTQTATAVVVDAARHTWDAYRLAR